MVKVEYNEKNRKLLLQLTEEIDHHSASRIRTRCDYEIQRYLPKEIVVDLNSVNFMDSAGIGLILGRYKMANMFGGNINIINVKPNIRKVLEMAGISKIMSITEGGEKDGN